MVRMPGIGRVFVAPGLLVPLVALLAIGLDVASCSEPAAVTRMANTTPAYPSVATSLPTSENQPSNSTIVPTVTSTSRQCAERLRVLVFWGSH